MISATEALRQCIEAMKLVDFKDCGESESLWKQLNDAQANAERVMRDGERQEPVCYCVPDAKGKPLFGKGWMFSPLPQLKATMPLYTHPAPSLQAVVEVPEGWQLVPKEPTPKMIDALVIGANKFDSWRKGYICMLATSPQPPAAPSGDVESEETDWDWIHAPPTKPGIYLHRHPVYKGVDKKVFVGWVSALEPLNQGIKRPQYAIHMRVCPVDEPLHMDRLTPEAWGGMWKKVDAETKE